MIYIFCSFFTFICMLKLESELKQKHNNMIQEMIEITPITETNILNKDYILLNTHCCSICANTLDGDDKYVKLKCNHIFHKNCITKWLNSSKKSNNYCPDCKKIIV